MTLLLLFACAAPGDSGAFEFPFGQDTPCGGEPVVSIGNGDRAWQPLSDGDTIAVHRHEAGGWYVPFSVETRNLAEVIALQATVSEVDSRAVLVDVSYQVKMIPSGTCSAEYPGLQGYLSEAPDLEALAGMPLVFSLAVRDYNGQEATSTVEGVAAVAE